MQNAYSFRIMVFILLSLNSQTDAMKKNNTSNAQRAEENAKKIKTVSTNKIIKKIYKR